MPLYKPTPRYPRLQAALEPKCLHPSRWRAWTPTFYCVKPQGHDGRHLHDVDPNLLK